MVMRNIINYRKQAYQKKGLFVYLGTTALEKGRGMNFDLDYVTTTVKETATDPFGARGLKVIQKPVPANAQAFAGVLTQNYPARTSGLQLVELALPGGCAMIAGIVPTVLNSTRLTCIVPSALQIASTYIGNAGLFGRAALPGRGTAISLQTRTNAAKIPWTEFYAGEAAYTTAAGTITCTDAFLYALAGDRVIVLSGGVANAAKAGVTYYIKTRTSKDAAIVSLTPGGAAYLTLAANAAKLCICVIPAAAPLSLAYLCEGEESGLQEFDIAVTNATTNPMVGGTTNLLGNITIAQAHIPPIVDGLFPGMLKLVRVGGALTGNYTITPASLGIKPDGGILATVTLSAAGGMALLRWTGQRWDCISVDAAGTAA